MSEVPQQPAPERVGLVGRVGSDIKRGWTRDNKHKTASFRFAVDKGHRDEAGDWVNDPTEWHTVWTYDTLAEHTFKNLRKGQEVVVLGTARKSTYEAQDGTQRESSDISAWSVGLSVRGVEIEVRRPDTLGINRGETGIER